MPYPVEQDKLTHSPETNFLQNRQREVNEFVWVSLNQYDDDIKNADWIIRNEI